MSSNDGASFEERSTARSALLRTLALAQLFGLVLMDLPGRRQRFFSHRYRTAQQCAFFHKQDRRSYVALDACGFVDLYSCLAVYISAKSASNDAYADVDIRLNLAGLLYHKGAAFGNHFADHLAAYVKCFREKNVAGHFDSAAYSALTGIFTVASESFHVTLRVLMAKRNSFLGLVVGRTAFWLSELAVLSDS
jgi:hypothetical protein